MIAGISVKVEAKSVKLIESDPIDLGEDWWDTGEGGLKSAQSIESDSILILIPKTVVCPLLIIMRIIIGIVLLLVELIGFLGASVFIGLWWMSDFVRGNSNASLFNATWALIVAAIMYHKYVWVLSRQHTPLHFYFYTAMSAMALTGYFYGILFRWI